MTQGCYRLSDLISCSSERSIEKSVMLSRDIDFLLPVDKQEVRSTHSFLAQTPLTKVVRSKLVDFIFVLFSLLMMGSLHWFLLNVLMSLEKGPCRSISC